MMHAPRGRCNRKEAGGVSTEEPPRGMPRGAGVLLKYQPRPNRLKLSDVCQGATTNRLPRGRAG